MTRLAMWAAAVTAAVALSAGPARAQFGYYSPPQTSPFPRAPISPYLNLARGGNPAINYYGLVRPQQEFQQSIWGLQRQVSGLGQQALQGEAARSSETTGHPTRFLNYSHYFMSQGGGAGSFPGARGPGSPIQGVGNNNLGVGQSPLQRGGGAPGVPGRR
ncbi:MAG TPA: hypothetical protein VFE78_25590 [Gemmataceae bacterium]|jgi:hypothetical protein|nr:hypothetical protein [Gemmataceae bacterium]